MPGSGAEGTCSSGSVLSSLRRRGRGSGSGKSRFGVKAEMGSLAPHPWPVYFRSSAIHEFSCCSSPTSKMMSVRSFTCGEEGAAVWGLEPCVRVPRRGKLRHSPSARRCRGCRASQGVCIAGPPGGWSRLLVAWAWNSRKPRGYSGLSLTAPCPPRPLFFC